MGADVHPDDYAGIAVSRTARCDREEALLSQCWCAPDLSCFLGGQDESRTQEKQGKAGVNQGEVIIEDAPYAHSRPCLSRSLATDFLSLSLSLPAPHSLPPPSLSITTLLRLRCGFRVAPWAGALSPTVPAPARIQRTVATPQCPHNTAPVLSLVTWIHRRATRHHVSPGSAAEQHRDTATCCTGPSPDAEQWRA